MPAFETLVNDFSLLEDWEDRYLYLIELGRKLPPFPEKARTEAHKVQGCVSQVWLIVERDKGLLKLQGDSDSHLVKGLIAVAVALYQDKTPQAALDVEALAAFQILELDQHLTPQRSNGIHAMITRIRSEATKLQS